MPATVAAAVEADDDVDISGAGGGGGVGGGRRVSRRGGNGDKSLRDWERDAEEMEGARHDAAAKVLPVFAAVS